MFASITGGGESECNDCKLTVHALPLCPLCTHCRGINSPLLIPVWQRYAQTFSLHRGWSFSCGVWAMAIATVFKATNNMPLILTLLLFVQYCFCGQDKTLKLKAMRH